MDVIERALQSLRLQNKPNISATAEEFHVNRSTLSKQFNTGQQSRKQKAQNQCLLSTPQERDLVVYINGLTERGLPPTPSMVRNFVYELVAKWPGKSWSQRFCQRWQNDLSSKYLITYDAIRFKADSQHSYQLYFDLVKQKIEEYDVLFCNTYNMDEKGFLIGFLTKTEIYDLWQAV